MRQVLIFKRPPGCGGLSFFFSLSLSLVVCLSKQQLCTPTGRFIRFGTCHETAAAASPSPSPSLSLLLLLAAAAFIAHRYWSPKRPAVLAVLGTCFTADMRLLLLLPARYTIARLCIIPLRPRFLATASPCFEIHSSRRRSC